MATQPRPPRPSATRGPPTSSRSRETETVSPTAIHLVIGLPLLLAAVLTTALPYDVALGHGSGGATRGAVLWSTVAFTSVLSVFVHGIAVTPVMSWLDHRRHTAAEIGTP